MDENDPKLQNLIRDLRAEGIRMAQSSAPRTDIMRRFKAFADSHMGPNDESKMDSIAETRHIFLSDDIFEKEGQASFQGVIACGGGSDLETASVVTRLLKSELGVETGTPKVERFSRPFFLGEPFNTLWIESLNLPLLYIYESSARSGHEHLPVHAIWLWRANENLYIASFVDDKGTIGSTIITDKDNEIHAGYERSIQHYVLFALFRKLARFGQPGTERVSERFKIGRGKERKLVKIKDIVHIRLKRTTKQAAREPNPNKIKWSHRWEIMAHWRKIDGIGKDDRGCYCVNGYTWVVAHTKGPQDKELVTKTRFVKG